ncbi:MAG: deoxyribodipyrimidine photo-lyase [Planctomycetota bacterium]
MRNLVWFRRDLRITDHPALSNACEQATEGVVAVFCITPEQWKEHDDSPLKVHFWMQNVVCLSKALAAIRIPLLIIECDNYDDIPKRISALATEHDCGSLFFHREYEVNEAERDKQVIAMCEASGVTTFCYDDRVIVPPANISTKEGNFYTVFTPYRRVWDTRLDDVGEPIAAPKKQSEIQIAPSDVPDKIDGYDFSSVRSDLWPAGEDEAHERLHQFMDRIDAYDDRRDIPSVCGTSVLSPYLAAGVVSPRQCLSSALALCKGDLSRSKGATTWVSELTWRDFYAHVLVGFPRVSKHLAFNRKNDGVQWSHDDSTFNAWTEGQTGYPIVDAGMRQLNQTGWMHNRLRMVTAMFLTKHLLIDWRWGEKYFMDHLIDGDLAANNGGWQWSASTGTDSVPYFRIFNPFSQSKRFDTDGDYIKKFCPELKDVPAAALHDAAKLRREIERREIDYPDFVVDYKEGRERALAAFKALN